MIRCQICKKTQLRLEEMVEGWPKMQTEWRQWKENKMMVFRPLLGTLFRLNWAKQTPGIMRRN